MEISETLATIRSVFDLGHEQGLMFQYVEDQPVDGRHVRLRGRELLSFGSCSYLGLETDPRMKEGAIRATERWGTQFSCSRAYISAGPYAAIEEMFSKVFGGYAMVTPTTTLGHLGALPVLVNEKDAIVLDHQVHASVQLASTVAKSNGAQVEVVRHGDRAKLEERIAELCRTKRRVWHTIDGVYSMFGDLPDVVHLTELLARHENLWLYVDDAHGMSIDGQHGRGMHYARMPPHPRMIVATSFAKAFAAGGGCLVFPDEEMRRQVRMCGAPLIFGGPMQPPMLGALQAGLDIHLTDEIYGLQQELKTRIEAFNALCVQEDLPLLVRNQSPVFFMKMSSLRLGFRMAARLRDNHRLYVNVSPYPSVPMKRTGLRVALTRHHTLEDLERLAKAIALELPIALDEEGMTRDDIEKNFAELEERELQRKDERIRRLFVVDGSAEVVRPSPKAAARPASREGLEIQHARTIDAIDPVMWDSLLGPRGNFDVATLRTLERTFRDRAEPENNWNFHYFVVRHEGRPVLATYFTEALWKDDALMRAEVSALLEERRANDPYFLTSRAMAMGSMMTEGNHLWLDKEGPWEAALEWMLEEADLVLKAAGGTVTMLRDLPNDDPAFDKYMLQRGFVKTPMLTAYELDVTFADDKAFLASLSNRTRKYMREEVLAKEPLFTTRVLRPGGEQASELDRAAMHDLYMGVKTRKLRMNTFEYPSDLFPQLLATPGWEVLMLHLSPEHEGPADGRAVGMGCCFAGPGRYVALLCGGDNVTRRTHVYRQLLWKTIRRARELGYRTVELGLDADTEKLRLGAKPNPQCIYLQLSDHFAGDVIGQVVQEVALRAQGRLTG